MGKQRLSDRQVYRLDRQKVLIEAVSRHGNARTWGLEVLDLGTECGLSVDNPGCLFGFAVGVEIDANEASKAWATGAYNMIHCGDALEFLRNTLADPWDLIFCCELIEHYGREDGLSLLHHLERLHKFSGSAVILTTPLGFMPQGAIRGNQHQIHRSGWEPEDFEARGWQINDVSEEHRLIVASLGIPE